MSRGEITGWLQRWRDGDAEALAELMPLVYDELRLVARRQLLRESTAHTLSPTGLVHEVYLRLVRQRQITAADREQFFSIAGQTMRRILVDHARARLRLKRGGDRPSLAGADVEDAQALSDRELSEVLAVDDALERLGNENVRAVRVIECRVFAGLTLEETAQALGLSSKSVQRTWATAAAWLRKELSGD
jgi:RNA polymerase sigma-70 factor (ECF subfamily)